MGDAQRRKVSSGKAGVRAAIGDGKEVGHTAATCFSKNSVKLSAKRRIVGDSLFVEDLDSSADEAMDESKEGVQDNSSCKQHEFINRPNVEPANLSSCLNVVGSDNTESFDSQSTETRSDINVNALPRKVSSLHKNVDDGRCSPKKTFSLVSNFSPLKILEDNSETYQSISQVTYVIEPERSDEDSRSIPDDFSRSIYPRKVFSLQQNIGQQFDFLKKTTSLITNFFPRDDYTRNDSSQQQCSLSKESRALTLEGRTSNTNLSLKKGSEMDVKSVSSIALDSQSAITVVDGKAAQEVKRRRGFSYEGVRERIHEDRSTTPAQHVAFTENGSQLVNDDDTKKSGVCPLKSSITESDLETSSENEQSCSYKQTQQAQQPCQQQGGACGQSLQSTCDVSSWSLCHYHSLPQWMQDNEFILSCHRPPLPSFFACFKSIFRLHTETLNIWTHLLGCVTFVAMGAYFLALPREAVWLQEKLAFGAFFGGGAACFAFSSAYHTLWCHSPEVGRLFSKLDYCGIALLIMGSFVPWLYYAFYCRGRLLAAYLALVVALGALSVLVSLWGRFGEPRFRPLRAGVFVAYGLSGIVPALHFAIAEGWRRAISEASLHWLALMGVLYVSGACIYALRVPERFFPGRCDLLFQSHQIFHVFVIIAALVHYHGLTEMAVYRLSFTDCASRELA